MANQEQLDILKQGVDVWNEWREENVGVDIDLSEVSLFGINLGGVNLTRATLTGASLIDARLSGADLSNANFSNANLNGANLKYANLNGANLSDANLSYASLCGADLTGADLTGADLGNAILTEIDFDSAIIKDATLGETIFGDVDLSTVKGLETVWHSGPSTIGIDTIIRSQGKIPEVFLHNAGVPRSIIKQIPDLIGSIENSQLYKCFISYSHQDLAFVERLHASLRSKGIHCWYDKKDMKIGDNIWHRIEESIRYSDKLLVVLSQHSVVSPSVEREVMAALDMERRQKKPKLFPITLDETCRQSDIYWVADLQRRLHIGDFTRWKNHNDYEKAFNRLLRDLKAEAMTD